MKKEEVLKRSRWAYKQASNKDEGFQYVESKGVKLGFAVFSMVAIFAMMLELFYGDSRTIQLMQTYVWVFFSALAYEKYRFTKSKTYLVTAIFGSLGSILNFIGYVTATLR